MGEHVCDFNAFVWVDYKTRPYKTFSLLAYLVWNDKRTTLDFRIGLLDSLRLKGRSSADHYVEDHSDSPAVDCMAVAVERVQYLGGQVVGRPTHCFSAFIGPDQLGGQAKISYFYLKRVRQE